MDFEHLKGHVKSGEIDTVTAVFPDLNGRLVGKRFTGSYFVDQVMKHGTHACNYLLTVNIEMDPLSGFDVANWEKGFGDFEMRPDLDSIRITPWLPGSAVVICDCVQKDGSLVSEVPRSVLRQQLGILESRRLKALAATELEFFLFHQSYHDAFAKGYRGLQPSSDYRIDYHTMQPARDELILRMMRNSMDAAGIRVESSKGEWGKGQHEINVQYDELLLMADKHVVFKQGLKEIAAQHGKAITFMPKPWADEVGSSCHIHVSLCQGGRNLFWDEKTNGPSEVFRFFLGGLIRYARELSYFFAPTINAYKRFQSESWAPTKLAWSYDNRTAGFRVVSHGKSFRIENRIPGADVNPYLAFAATVAAGLAGIDEKLDCGRAYEGNAYADPNLASVPHSLEEAADLLKGSKMARQAFGDAVIDYYVRTAELEVQAFRTAVTDWERARYFERI